MEIINRIGTPNSTEGRGGKVPDVIVCHITDGNYPGCVDWMKNPAAQASAHFCVSRKGEIAQIVDIKNTAWANGTSTVSTSAVYYKKSTAPIVNQRAYNANSFSVSIEHEGIYTSTLGALTDVQLEATVWLIKHISEEIKKIYKTSGIIFDRNHILGHYEVNPATRTNCPGHEYPWDQLIKKLNEPAVIQPPPPTTEVNSNVPDWQVDAFEDYVARGYINTPEYWEPKLGDNITVGEVFSLLDSYDKNQ